MTSNSVLNKAFALSIVLHGALLAWLVLLGTRALVFSDTPLRVRILEPPALPSTPGPVPAPQAVSRGAAPPQGRFSSEPSIREERETRQGEIRVPGTPGLEEPTPPRGAERGSREKAARTPGSSEETKGVEPPPPFPQVAARPAPQPTAPSTQRLSEPPRGLPPVTAPERSGLTLGGPPPGASVVPQGKTVPPGGEARPSIRDQIARLGSGLYGDAGEAGKETIHLDSRDPVFIPYLARLKRRIQNEWVYPEAAWSRGVSGELLLVFTLNKNGSMTNVHLVQSSGFPILDQEALRAVKQAAPFDPFPPQWGEEPKNIAASFRYYLPYRLPGN